MSLDWLTLTLTAAAAFIGASVGAWLRGFIWGVHATGAVHRFVRRLRQ